VYPDVPGNRWDLLGALEAQPMVRGDPVWVLLVPPRLSRFRDLVQIIESMTTDPRRRCLESLAKISKQVLRGHISIVLRSRRTWTVEAGSESWLPQSSIGDRYPVTGLSE
jgi:hypothetical protein